MQDLVMLPYLVILNNSAEGKINFCPTFIQKRASQNNTNILKVSKFKLENPTFTCVTL